MLQFIKSALAHPQLRGLDIDAKETTRIRSRIIQQKHFLKKLYASWYSQLASAIPQDGKGPIVEIGSGGGFLQETIKGLMTSEIFFLPNLSLVLDGRRLPFRTEALQGILMLDVFHHIPDVAMFLKDAARCIQPNGFIGMIEPWVTPWSKLIYSCLHHEPFDPRAKDWRIHGETPLSTANQALAWIVFTRDVQRFAAAHPEWRIRSLTCHTPFAYLLSGGVSLRGFVPGKLYDAVARMEGWFAPLMNTWAMFATILLTRVPDKRFDDDRYEEK